jgi:hypothetical protein
MYTCSGCQNVNPSIIMLETYGIPFPLSPTQSALPSFFFTPGVMPKGGISEASTEPGFAGGGGGLAEFVARGGSFVRVRAVVVAITLVLRVVG